MILCTGRADAVNLVHWPESKSRRQGMFEAHNTADVKGQRVDAFWMGITNDLYDVSPGRMDARHIFSP